eukprot:Skav206532  [mRNA]  locus=scaffold504:79392:85508:+ [translate_table: standard]
MQGWSRRLQVPNRCYHRVVPRPGSLSRQNLLAEERERKRFWANEQLHAEEQRRSCQRVQELQDALAELRVTSADEMEAQGRRAAEAMGAQRLKEHQVLAASAEMKDQPQPHVA